MIDIMQDHCLDILDAAEAAIQLGDQKRAYAVLRELSIDDFGALLYGVPARYSGLKAMLPLYPNSDTQKAWTGNEGTHLLQKTCMFARMVSYRFREISGRELAGNSILDYGCGWGRILRQMFYFSDPSRVFGVDPWNKSISVCNDLGLESNVYKVDYEPSELPFNGELFGLIYAFSVFTHISQQTSDAILSVCRKHITPRGLFVVTTRPVEYWSSRGTELGSSVVDDYIRRHKAREYVFHPAQKLSSTELIYGETSVSVQTFGDRAKTFGWRVAAIDHLISDPYQLLLFLAPI